MFDPDLLILLATVATMAAAYLHKRTGKLPWHYARLGGLWLQQRLQLWKARRK